MPFIIGATRPIAALAATAASIALPPCSRIATPARVPIGCSAATTPYCEMIIDRPCERSCAIAGLVWISAVPVMAAIHDQRVRCWNMGSLPDGAPVAGRHMAPGRVAPGRVAPGRVAPKRAAQRVVGPWETRAARASARIVLHHEVRFHLHRVGHLAK